MRKKITLISALVVVCIVLFAKWNTEIYIINDGCYFDIDYQISIDNNIIISDSIIYPYWYQYYAEKKMKWGFHKIKVSINKANVTQTKTIFLLPNQDIRIDFEPSNKLLLEFATEDIKEFFNKQSILRQDSFFEARKESFFVIRSWWNKGLD